MQYYFQPLHITFRCADHMVICNLANSAVRLINEDIDITRADFAKQLPEPSFDKVIQIMNLHEDGVANGHYTHTVFRRWAADLPRFCKLSLAIGCRKSQSLSLSNMVSIRGERVSRP